MSFVFLVHNPATGSKKAFSGRKSSAGKPFYTRPQKTEISWTLRRPPSKLNVKAHPEAPADGEKAPIFRSTDYRSTLDIGWIPNHGIDFFSLFILDLQKKWRDLLEKADDHLSSNVSFFPSENFVIVYLVRPCLLGTNSCDITAHEHLGE